MFIQAIVSDDWYIKCRELYQLLQLQYMDVVNLVTAYTTVKIWKFLMGVILQRCSSELTAYFSTPSVVKSHSRRDPTVATECQKLK
jgi:hypothetical protein